MSAQFYTFSFFIQITATLILCGLAAYAWRQRRKPGALTFFWLMIFSIELVLSRAFLYGSKSLQSAIFWGNCLLLPLSAIPPLVLIFVLLYNGQARWLSRRRIAGLFIIPAITQLLAWTSNRHKLFFVSSPYSLVDSGVRLNNFKWGLWFHVHAGYSFLLLFISFGILLWMILRPFHLYRKQAAGLLAGVAVPSAAIFAVTYMELPQVLVRIMLPICLCVMGALWAWIVFRHHFLDVLPVARDRLIDCMEDGMLVLDAGLRLIDINPAMRRIPGLSSVHELGRPLETLLQDWEALYALLQQRRDCHAEIPLLRRGGAYHYDIRVSVLRDKQGQHSGQLVIVRDITARKQAETELRAAYEELQNSRRDLLHLNQHLEQRVREESEARHQQEQLLVQKSKLESLGSLAAGIAHEINQPLTRIRIGTESLLLKIIGQEEIRPDFLEKRCRITQGSIERISKIIEHVRTFSRDQHSLRTEEVNVNAVIDNALSFVRTQYQHYNILFEIDLQATGKVLGNQYKLEQVILNLFSNARDAIETETHDIEDAFRQNRICVSSGDRGATVRIEIEDSGCGIPADVLENIFEPFFTTKDVGRGTGLGLSISYGIIKDMQGDMRVDSRLHEGATVTIELPRIC